jgi:hypothetical protein
MTGLAGKMAVAEALARALDLLWLLAELDGGGALTQTGNLNRRFVQAAADRSGWDFPASREPRTTCSTCTSCAASPRGSGWPGARAANSASLPRAAACSPTSASCGAQRPAGCSTGNDFSVFAGELLLALLLDTGSMPPRRSWLGSRDGGGRGQFC